MKREWTFHAPTFEADLVNPDLPLNPWSGHRRFAYDLVTFLEPETIVELGTHYGSSFFAFSQAMKDHALPTRLVSVDHWKGDPQAGEYDDTVFDLVSQTRAAHFGSLALEFKKSTFREAVGDFADSSIDLLHIDGLHTYEAVSEDFHTWLPKMRPDGVVLLHDIGSYVHYESRVFWQELKARYPLHLEFDFSWGLGVVFLSEKSHRAAAESGLLREIDRYQKATNKHADDDRAKLTEASFRLGSLQKMIDDRDEHIATLSRALDEQTRGLQKMITDRDEHIAALTRALEAKQPAGASAAGLPAPNPTHENARNELEMSATKKIAVVTRTKNRTVLLRRALESVSCQTFKDFIWVVVNDAGAREGVDEIVHEARRRGVDAMCIHNEVSHGMEAASNVGIRASQSEYIVIHDDDDSWQPTFLEETSKFLDADTGKKFGGVITHSVKVEEILVDDNTCTIVERSPFNEGCTGIYLADLAKVNLFPPISFLFRREMYDKVGGFDESLPVLGDWDFNLKLLLQTDIAVLRMPLANYHHRINMPPSAFRNTVVHGVNQHQLYDMTIRNKHLRQDLVSGTHGLGFLLNEVRLNVGQPPPGPTAKQKLRTRLLALLDKTREVPLRKALVAAIRQT